MQCPFCESQCTPAEVRFVADDTLRGDPVLGPDAAVRFRPIHFTPDGHAIAPGGGNSDTPACPTCRAAWHPKMRTDPTGPMLGVGPDGMSAAITAAESNGWTIVRDDLPRVASHTDQAAIVTCTQSQTHVHFILTTRGGAVSALADALAQAALAAQANDDGAAP